MEKCDSIIRAIGSGYRAIVAIGNIYDFILDNGTIVFLPYSIAEKLFEMGYVVLRYSRSTGAYIHRYSDMEPSRAREVDSRLRAVGIEIFIKRERDTTADEIQQFFRGVNRLLMTNANDKLCFALLVDYTEHLAPAVSTSAAASEEHTFVAESLHSLAMSPALHKSPNVLVCFTRDGFQNTLLNDLYRTEYRYPGENETKDFAELIAARNNREGENPYAPLEPHLNSEEFGRLTRGLRLRDIEALFREAKADNLPVNRDRILSAKAASVLSASEGTLEILNTFQTLDDIIGLEVVKAVFRQYAEKLRQGDPSSPRAVLMAGPPGTAKSTFAPILAHLAGFNIVQFKDIKNMYVGESERRLNLALSLVESLAPTILFIDEITEMTPSRHTRQEDGGVSQNILGKLFLFSAREDLRGRVLILAASNVAERLDVAWHNRFTIIPFLELVPEDLKKLFPAMERRITGQATLDPHSPLLAQAAMLLHQKGASPRQVFDIVNHALLFHTTGQITAEAVYRAVEEFTGVANPMAVAYTSLTAISLASFKTYYPWSLNPQTYLYPWYLEGIVDKNTGDIDREALRKRISEYKRYVNL